MKNINYDELKTAKDQSGNTLINVLSSEDFAKDSIPGSINVPLKSADFTQQVEQKIGGKDAPVIVYCASSSCSASRDAAEKLEQAGFTNVTAYEGGMKEWQEKSSRQAA